MIDRELILSTWNSLRQKISNLKSELEETDKKYDELSSKRFEDGLEYSVLMSDLRDIKKKLKDVCSRVDKATEDVKQKEYYACNTVSGIKGMVERVIIALDNINPSGSNDDGPTLEEID